MSLDELRKKIDEIDHKLVEFLNERTRTALEIGKLKQSEAGETYVPAREKEVLDRVQSLSNGPLAAESIRAIYREIMSASLAIENEVKVAYLGPSATFTHHAARSRFGTSVEYVACESVPDVFAMVEKGNSDYGVVPVENSIHGVEAVTIDCLSSTSLRICAEIFIPISQCLLSSSPRDRISKIYSHPQAFAQCSRWLRMEMPGVELITTSSTAKAAETAALEEHAGALASPLAAEMYHLDVVAENIADAPGNETRFMILAKSYGKSTGEDRTSVVFSVKHEAGSLYRALESFKKYDLNMTKIESRPSRGKPWEYYFFVEFEGHTSDSSIAEALKDLEKHCTYTTVLGSYPRAK